MRIHVKQLGDIVAAAVEGDLDAHEAMNFSQLLTDVVNNESPWLIVEMSRVTFLDSTGLAALVKLRRQCETHFGGVWLVSLPPAVQTILEITRLDAVFDCASDIQTAVNAIRCNLL